MIIWLRITLVCTAVPDLRYISDMVLSIYWAFRTNPFFVQGKMGQIQGEA